MQAVLENNINRIGGVSMSHGRVLSVRSVTAAVVAAIAASAAGAQQTADGLEEVVVTAQFREQRLQDTPLAITAVNAEMLEARGQTSIAQVAAQAPNVSLRPQPQNGGSAVFSRASLA